MYKLYKNFVSVFSLLVLFCTANSKASVIEQKQLWNGGFGNQVLFISIEYTDAEQDFAIRANSRLTYKIVQAENRTFGYEIFSDEKIIIRQLSKPGIPGNEGFKAQADAEKVARLIIQKIKRGELPPTLTIEELKKLNVI